jgi:hypothetical protein
MPNNYQEFCMRYGMIFDHLFTPTSISPVVGKKLSYQLTLGKAPLLKQNNFFAIANSDTKKYKRFSTPMEGVQSGIDLILKNPLYTANKVGTLKANPKKQLQKIQSMLGLST